MITVRRSEERRHDRRGVQEAWLTFHGGIRDDMALGFEGLELLNEQRLAPGGSSASHQPHDSEILTFVREGALAHEDSQGRSGVISAGEFHRMTTSRSLRHVLTNASPRDGAHLFQASLRPSPTSVGPVYEQKRFSTAERRGVLCLVGAADARRGSLRLNADARVYSALLDVGQHVVHELAERRKAWLHVVQGEVTLADLVLATGDGAGVSVERAVSITARRDSELLLFDLAPGEPMLSGDGEPARGRDLARQT